MVLRRPRAAQLSWHTDLQRWCPAYAGDQWSLWGRYRTLHLHSLQLSRCGQHISWGLHRRSDLFAESSTLSAILHFKMWQCDYNVLFSCILPTGASSSDSDGEGAVSHLRSGTMPQYVCFNVNLLNQWTSDPKQVNWDLEPPLRPIVFKWALKRSLKSPNTNQRPGHTPYTRCRRSGWKIQPGLSVFHTFSELKKKKKGSQTDRNVAKLPECTFRVCVVPDVCV